MINKALFSAFLAAGFAGCAGAAIAQDRAPALELRTQIGPSLDAPERLDSIAARKCTSLTDSGLGYSILKSGAGPSPGPAARVRVAYAGYFLSDGAKFDTGDNSSFAVNGVIPGFQEGLQLMQRGAVYRLCVPSRLGYGARGAGAAIPPDSHLIFLLMLRDF